MCLLYWHRSKMPKTGGRNSLVIVAIALGLVASGAFVIKSKKREA